MSRDSKHVTRVEQLSDLNKPLHEPVRKQRIAQYAGIIPLLRHPQIQCHSSNIQRTQEFASHCLVAGQDVHGKVGCLSPGEVDSHLHSQLEWEVIVVDDNSPDGTQEIAKQLAKVYGEDKIVSMMKYSLPFWV
jgi:hypothetical protein